MRTPVDDALIPREGCGFLTICVVLITHITHMRKKNIYNKVA